MKSGEPPISVGRIGRFVFGTATVICGVIGIVVRNDARWFVAAGSLGLLWWFWDLFFEHLLVPLGHWASHLFVSGIGEGTPPNIRPTLDDTVRLLEGHLEHRASRQVEINSAIRLEEIYRTVKNDPDKARSVIQRVRERYPDAPELTRYIQELD